MSWWKEIEQLGTVTPIFTHHLWCSLFLGLFLSFTQDLHCKQNEARTSCCDISWCRHQHTDLGLDLQLKLLELLLQCKQGLLIPGAPKVILEHHDKMGSVLFRKSLLLLPTFNYFHVLMKHWWITWFSFEPSINPGVPSASTAKSLVFVMECKQWLRECASSPWFEMDMWM